MGLRSILSHIAIFLSGVFLALLISTAHLTNNSLHDVSTRNSGGSSLQNALMESVTSGGTRGGTSVKELQSTLQEERLKMQELQDRITQL